MSTWTHMSNTKKFFYGFCSDYFLRKVIKDKQKAKELQVDGTLLKSWR